MGQCSGWHTHHRCQWKTSASRFSSGCIMCQRSPMAWSMHDDATVDHIMILIIRNHIKQLSDSLFLGRLLVSSNRHSSCCQACIRVCRDALFGESETRIGVATCLPTHGNACCSYCAVTTVLCTCVSDKVATRDSPESDDCCRVRCHHASEYCWAL
jgi:hypothetical protein